jgi:hypothetical protein
LSPGYLNALTVDPVSIICAQESHNATYIIREPYPAQSGYTGNPGIDFLIVTRPAPAEIGFNGTRSNHIDPDPFFTQFLCQVTRQNFNGRFGRTINGRTGHGNTG